MTDIKLKKVDYLSELFEGDPIRIELQLIDADHKRIHYVSRMFHGETGRLAAVNECLAMNINLESKKSDRFPVDVQAQIDVTLEAHRAVPIPEQVGRVMGIRKKE